MKTFKLTSTLLSVTIFLLMSSCTQEDAFLEETTTNSVTKSITTSENFSILSINDIDKERASLYTHNYRVEIESSSIDFKQDKIQLEIPIPKNDFRFLKAYNVSTENNVAILYVIERDEQNVVVNLPIEYVVQDEISMSDLGIDKELLESNGCMRVHVMNNSEEDLLLEEEEILNCFISSLDLYSCKNEDVNFSNCFSNENGSIKRPKEGIAGTIQK